MRREFTKAIKVAVIRRTTKGGLTYCEGCGRLAKKWRIDHRRADGLLGEPTLENAWLLGPCCYAAKDAQDTSQIALAKRREAFHLGTKKQFHRWPPRVQRTRYQPVDGAPRLMREGFVPAREDR